MTYLCSACLLASPCRYDGASKPISAALEALMQKAVLIPVCPEILGGLPTPRPPAELQGERVMTEGGNDVTAAYRRGAEEVLRLVRLYRADGVILKEKSPSCGTDGVYDGSFTRTIRAGLGVTAALLSEAGIPLFSENHLPAV